MLEAIFWAERNSWWIDWGAVDCVWSSFGNVSGNWGRVAAGIIGTVSASRVGSRLLDLLDVVELLRNNVLVDLTLLEVRLLSSVEFMHELCILLRHAWIYFLGPSRSWK